MPDTLLSTKLYIPRARGALVPRPRLIERLEAGLRGKLTLVSAPAGYGKTTLLGDWIHRRGAVVAPEGGTTADPRQRGLASAPLQVAWLSLEPADNDPARFLGYLIAALQVIDEGIGAELQAVVSQAQAIPMESLLARLVHEIEAATEKSDRRALALVLDDYHVITAQAVHQALRFLLDHLPPPSLGGLHLLIAGRTDPPLPISRLRVQGEVTEIRAADLRFTPEEAAALLNDRMGLGLSPAEIAALDARTEGWIASLQLAAMSLRGREDKQAFIAAFSGSHRYVLDYLMDEVMTRQPPEVRAFLRQTSILDRFCAPLCDALRFDRGKAPGGSKGAARDILRQLEDDNLFLIPLDDERRWYRYHHLFADFLAQRLREQEPDAIPKLHRRASRWYEAEGTTDDAIEHALQGGDVGRATRLVDGIAAELIVRRNPNALLKWVNRLPSDLCRDYPVLCLWHAWALVFVGQLDAIEPMLKVAEAHFDRVPHLPVAGFATTIRAYLANQVGDLSQALVLSQQALDQMADAPPERITLIYRGAAVIWLAVNYRYLGDLDRARELFVESALLNRQAGNYYGALASTEQLADLAMVQGQLHHAEAHFRQGLQMAQEWSEQEDKGRGPLVAAGGPHLGLGSVFYQWNDLAGAALHAQRAAEFGEWGDYWMRMHSYRLLACLKLAEGEDEAAYDLLQKSCTVRDRISVRQRNISTEPGLEQLRILLSRRRPEMAHLLTDVAERVQAQGLRANPASADAEHPVDFASPTGYRREVEYADLARALIALDRAAEAPPLLERLLAAARSMGRWGDVIRYLLQQAVALHALGDIPSALASLAQALPLAEPEGYVRIFVDEGPPMRELLQVFRQAQPAISPSYVDKLLAAFGPREDDSSFVLRPSPTQSWDVESLSTRELEVLHLIAAGHKYAQISDQLVISLNTVRHHTRNIFGKLDVHSRSQAIVRARELGLL